MHGRLLFALVTVFVLTMASSVKASELASPRSASADNLEMTVCGVDIANPPFYLFVRSETPDSGERNGVAYDLIREASRQLGIKIQVVRYPWKRCLAMVKNGRVDGVMGASYLSERVALGHYPRTETGEVDYGRIIYSNTYWVYTNDKAVSWDGKVLVLPPGGVAGTGLGYSSGTLLRDLGAEVHEEYKPSRLAAMLMNRRVSAIAGYAMQIEPHLASHSMRTGIARDSVWRLPIPLQQDKMFLLVSKPFYQSQKDTAEAIWSLFGELHRSGKYDGMLNNYLAE